MDRRRRGAPLGGVARASEMWVAIEMVIAASLFTACGGHPTVPASPVTPVSNFEAPGVKVEPVRPVCTALAEVLSAAGSHFRSLVDRNLDVDVRDIPTTVMLFGRPLALTTAKFGNTRTAYVMISLAEGEARQAAADLNVCPGLTGWVREEIKHGLATEQLIWNDLPTNRLVTLGLSPAAMDLTVQVFGEVGK